MCIGRKLQSEVELGLEPTFSKTRCRAVQVGFLSTVTNVCSELLISVVLLWSDRDMSLPVIMQEMKIDVTLFLEYILMSPQVSTSVTSFLSLTWTVLVRENTMQIKWTKYRMLKWLKLIFWGSSKAMCIKTGYEASIGGHLLCRP